MIVLGIDPGSRKCGYAVLKYQNRQFKSIHAGTIDVAKLDPFHLRLTELQLKAKQLVSQFRPEHICLESLIYVKSPTALIKLAQARGAMLASFGQTHPQKIYEYSPNLIKTTVTGHGHADKKAIQKALNLFVGKLNYNSDDASDALAVCVCHVLNYSSQISGEKEILFKGTKTLYRPKRNLKSQLGHFERGDKI